MDNQTIEVISEGKENLSHALMIVGRKTVGFSVKDNTLVLYWASHDSATLLPYEMEIKEAIDFVWGWLQRAKPSESKPDIDGDVEMGFRVFTESWGQVFGMWQAYVAIQPHWAFYGK